MVVEVVALGHLVLLGQLLLAMLAPEALMVEVLVAQAKTSKLERKAQRPLALVALSASSGVLAAATHPTPPTSN